MLKKFALGALALVALTAPAYAHPGTAIVNSFAGGFFHPLTGLDHVLAMVAVGLWAAQQGGRALWAWPLAFVSVMLVGGALGVAGVAMPFVEPGILASILVLGLMVAFAVRLPVATGAAIVGVFALMHGHAHGAEMGGHTALLFAAGFTLATALLHGAGIAIGLSARRLTSKWALRAAGAATAVLGFGLALAG